MPSVPDPPSEYANRAGLDALDALPRINRDIAARSSNPEALIEHYSPIFKQMLIRVESRRGSVDIETARKLLNVVDQVVGSIERHAQMRGDRSGEAKDRLPNVDALLTTLARLSDLPSPRGDHYTYWFTLYEGRQLTHMGTDGERAFGEAVRGLDGDQRQNSRSLAPVVDGGLPITSNEAVELLLAAAERETAIRERMLHLWKRNASGERNLPVPTFTVDMRTFLVAYRVAGTPYSGPNAADVAGQVLHDLTVGIIDDDYKTKIVPIRFARMDSADRALVDAAMERKHSVLTRLLEVLPITPLELISYSPQISAGYLEALPKSTIDMLDAFTILATEGGKIWGLISRRSTLTSSTPSARSPPSSCGTFPSPPPSAPAVTPTARPRRSCECAPATESSRRSRTLSRHSRTSGARDVHRRQVHRGRSGRRRLPLSRQVDGGEQLEHARLGWHGIAGDRRLAFLRQDDQSGLPWLSAREVPAVLGYRATYASDHDVDRGKVVVQSPTGRRFAVTSAQLLDEVTRLSGHPLHLVRLHRGTFDSMAVSIISTSSIASAGNLAERDLDVRRFRPNVLIESLDSHPFPEDRWIGDLLVFGDTPEAARVRVNRRDTRCSIVNVCPNTLNIDKRVLGAIVRERKNLCGVYGSTERPGSITVGDVVRRRKH